MNVQDFPLKPCLVTSMGHLSWLPRIQVQKKLGAGCFGEAQQFPAGRAPFPSLKLSFPGGSWRSELKYLLPINDSQAPLIDPAISSFLEKVYVFGSLGVL